MNLYSNDAALFAPFQLSRSTVRVWSHWRKEERFFLGIIGFVPCQAYKMYVETSNGFAFVGRLIYCPPVLHLNKYINITVHQLTTVLSPCRPRFFMCSLSKATQPLGLYCKERVWLQPAAFTEFQSICVARGQRVASDIFSFYPRRRWNNKMFPVLEFVLSVSEVLGHFYLKLEWLPVLHKTTKFPSITLSVPLTNEQRSVCWLHNPCVYIAS